ncbi:MAG: hypothetical protein KUG65_05630 [Sphingomonadaceae bacterium]|nr:hypothetical protein [Sphingomonadaceae bacterium]
MSLKIASNFAIAASATLIAGCAAYDSPPEQTASVDAKRDCFFLAQVNGFNSAGKDTIHVNVGPGRTYEFKTFGSCPDLGFSDSIAFDKKGPGTICRGMDVDLIVPSSIGPRRCPVSMIRRLPTQADGE